MSGDDIVATTPDAPAVWNRQKALALIAACAAWRSAHGFEYFPVGFRSWTELHKMIDWPLGFGQDKSTSHIRDKIQSLKSCWNIGRVGKDVKAAIADASLFPPPTRLKRPQPDLIDDDDLSTIPDAKRVCDSPLDKPTKQLTRVLWEKREVYALIKACVKWKLDHGQTYLLTRIGAFRAWDQLYDQIEWPLGLGQDKTPQHIKNKVGYLYSAWVR